MTGGRFGRHPGLEFLVPVLVTITAYYPALFHVARSDQLAYLADMAETDDWFTLAVMSFSFARERLFAGGDQLLFRPLLYFVLGTEKWLFGYNFLLWQAVGIVLHIGVLWTLFRLLRHLGFRWGALLLTSLTAALLPGMDLVIWHHLHAYLLFSLLILVVLRQAHLHVLEGHARWSRILTVTLLLLAASFVYEVGAVYCILFAGFLWATSPAKAVRSTPDGLTSLDPLPRSTTFIPLAPAFLYAFASAADFWWRGPGAPELHQISVTFSPLGTVTHAFSAALWWIKLGVQVGPIDFLLRPIQRIVVLNSPVLQWAPLDLFLALAAGASASLLVAAHLRSPSRRPDLAFTWLLLALLATYTLIVVAGRTNPRGLEIILTTNLYYTYLFWMLLVPLVASLTRLGCPRFLSRSLAVRAAVTVAFSVLVPYNVYRVHFVNKALADLSDPVRSTVATIERLRTTHGDSPDFSFSVAPGSKGNPPLLWLRKTGDPPGRSYTLLEALYPRHYRATGGQYHLTATGWVLQSSGPLPTVPFSSARAMARLHQP